MNEKYVISLGFTTDTGKTYTLRLTGADPSVSDTDVSDAMRAVIESGVISHANGRPTAAKSAKLIKTETQPIDVN